LINEKGKERVKLHTKTKALCRSSSKRQASKVNCCRAWLTCEIMAAISLIKSILKKPAKHFIEV
jgi:hypothetical protein